MTTRLPLLLAASWLVLPGLARAAQDAELSPEKVAQIRRDESQALSKVNDEFGNRKPSEMSNEERGEAVDKQQAASAAVLEKHGVSAKDYARYEARMTPEDNARAKAEEQRLQEQAAQAAKPPEPPAALAPEDIPVQEGFSNENPVELETVEGAGPIVDVGLPGEAGAAPAAEVASAQKEQPAKRAPARASSQGIKRKKSKR
ncbi:hypothetical protein [Pyxidicoccus xibeiensis]|uniref:hypothetical protein n=1 Tax=Pyxidicoccus xibeiensis TaxID=2906759 RepID=UPI0020A70AED|nr:hypothetical protein [Pyxidicoccus xibeiensis]MCP3145158.1 hypothetical protein [Pyxidicoccus xibeiensis]